MKGIRIRSVDGPLKTPEIAHQVSRIVHLADAMGLLEELPGELDLDYQVFCTAVVDPIARAGIGTELESQLCSSDADIQAERLSRMLRLLSNALYDSPSPPHEWESLFPLLGVDQLASLVGTSQSSAQRYRTGTRATPDRVAARLHFLTSIVSDLAGAYNEFGIRRWFMRSRKTLGGKSPAELLDGDWDPDDTGPRSVRDRASSLRGAGAT